MRKRITKRAIEALVPEVGRDGRRRASFLWDTAQSGFGCKVTPKGTKVFVLQYRTREQSWKDAPKRITLGRYPAMDLDDARELASDLALEARAGRDPAEEWRKRDLPTVADLATRFLEEYLPRKKRPPRESTIETYERIFRVHVTPALGTKPVGRVTIGDVESLHDRMRDKPYQANRMLAVLLQAFDQAERWGWRPLNTNPAKHVDRYPEERRGARKEVMLTAKQMADLVNALDEEERRAGDIIACSAIPSWKARTEGSFTSPPERRRTRGRSSATLRPPRTNSLGVVPQRYASRPGLRRRFGPTTASTSAASCPRSASTPATWNSSSSPWRVASIP